jgi:hypothetical protein
MNRPVIQTLPSSIRTRVSHRLVVLLFYALMALCLSAATLVVLEQQSLSRIVALVPSSHAATWGSIASPTPGEGRV